MQENKLSSISKGDSEEEIGEFWDSNDFTEFDTDALTSQAFSREGFLQSLDRFYKAIDKAARTIEDFSQKQLFLNTIYEKFFQGFSVKVADTHGLVYTPQPIVNFMVRSAEDILQKEFGKSLSSPDVHILDPFVGTEHCRVPRWAL